MLINPFPASRESLASYSAFYVTIQSHKEESLTSIFSSLRYYHKDHNLPWVTDSDAFFVSAVRKGLQKTQANPGRTPKYALTACRIDTIQSRLDLKQFAHLELITLLRLGHDGLLRTGELLRLRWGDVSFHEEVVAPHDSAAARTFSATLCIHKSKMNKSGSPEQVLIPFYGLTSTPMLLRLYRQTYAQQRPQRFGPTAWLFPPWSSEQQVSSAEPLSKSSLRRTLALFLEPTETPHSGFSLRAGGASDLFENGVPEKLIKHQGRWASEAYRLYIRDNPKFHAKSMASAFAAARNAPLEHTDYLCTTEANEHGQCISNIQVTVTDTLTLATAPDRGHTPSSSSSIVSSTGERIMTSF
jgi:integrase